MPRWVKFGLFCAALAASGWTLSYYRDWFFYYLQRSHTVRDVDAFGAALRQTGLALDEAGRVRYGAQSWPLWVVRKPALTPGAPTACLMGSLHGNEPAGAQALLALAQDMARSPQRYARLNYVMVPLANPWGWAHDLRRNASNQDAARQFVTGQSPESALLKALFAQSHCDALIDLHEDRLHAGFYFLTYAPASLPDVQNALAAVEQRTGIAHADRPAGGIWNIPEADFAGVSLTTASLWARMQGVPNTYIVETHDAQPLAQRVAIHTAAIDELTKLLITRNLRDFSPQPGRR